MSNVSGAPQDPIPAVTGAGGLRPGTLQVTVEANINKEQLFAALDRILELHGCPSCGLNGLDLRLRPQDVLFADRQLPGVRDISRIGFGA